MLDIQAAQVVGAKKCTFLGGIRTVHDVNNDFSIVIPNKSHEAEYNRVMNKWENFETNIQPELMRRYSSKDKNNPVTYDK